MSPDGTKDFTIFKKKEDYWWTQRECHGIC
jgi:hypothetical protein